MYVRGAAREPEQLLELYEFEGCPFCRRVREVLSELDLNAVIYPCPPRGSRFRTAVRERGGREMFPYLVDPNTGVEMYESSEIIEYLQRTYGGAKPSLLLSKQVSIPTGVLASVVRGRQGRRARVSRAPDQRLELYSFEASPYCRIAKEALCDLELPYVLHNCAKGSRHRAAFVERSGREMFPYLVDPDEGVEMFESADIRDYLYDTYGGQH